MNKPIPIRQGIKTPDARAAVDKEWNKLEKLPAWQGTKVKSKKAVIAKAQKRRKDSSFCDVDGLVQPQEFGVGAKVLKNKGRVVHRVDVMKDDAGSYAVFTEQGSSASQVTAAEILDVIARLPGAEGQASDVVSASTQVKMEDAPTLLKVSESEWPKNLAKHSSIGGS